MKSAITNFVLTFVLCLLFSAAKALATSLLDADYVPVELSDLETDIGEYVGAYTQVVPVGDVMVFREVESDGTGCSWDKASGYCTDAGKTCFKLGVFGKGQCTNPPVGNCYCYVP